ncbi:MAG: sulfatase [Planctomycetaceae bacterium]|nr:sulfatase [Planctomycetaceae bacterium]
MRAVAILAWTLLFVGLAAANMHASPPNVLMIVSDDQAWTDYGFMGHPRIQTPNLDRLARESAVFPRGYVPMSLCRPSLATIITGLYPHQHGTAGNDPRTNRTSGTPRPRNEDYLRLNRACIARFEALQSLPRLLGEHGYASLQTGKWWEGSYAGGGFTQGMTHGDPSRGGRHGDAGLEIGREGVQPILDFIGEHRETPWFVWYAPMLPHSPHNPPERLLAKYRGDGISEHIAAYHAMCELFDETCGALLDALKAHDLERNTLVVYVADNGWIQNPESPQFAARSKRSPYEGGIRTPIMLRWPDQIAPARYDDTLVSSIDLFPTIAAATGATPRAKLPGIDLLSVCAADGKCDRDAVFGEIYEHDMPDIDDPVSGLLFRWIIEGNWKLIAPVTAGVPPELYDLAADPREEHNLADEHPQVVARLSSRLDQWWPVSK